MRLGEGKAGPVEAVALNLQPALRRDAEWDLPHGFSLEAAAGLSLEGPREGRQHAIGTLALTLDKAWSPAWRSFAELSGQRLATRRSADAVAALDAGVRHSIRETLQLSFGASRGVVPVAPAWAWGLELVLRF